MSKKTIKYDNRPRLVILGVLIVLGLAMFFTGMTGNLVGVDAAPAKAYSEPLPVVPSTNTNKLVSTTTSNVETASDKSPIGTSGHQYIGHGTKKVYTLKLDPSRTVELIGEVGPNAIEASHKITELSKQSNKPIYLILTGPGGSVVTGQTLIAAIQLSRAPVITICDVLCASMDSMIHQYGAQRFMTDRSIIMFHQATAGTQGDVDRMYNFVTFLKSYVNKIERDVAARWGISFEEYKARITTEVWLDSEDAVKQHVADGIVSLQILNELVPQFSNDKKQTEAIKSLVKPNTNIEKITDLQWKL